MPARSRAAAAISAPVQRRDLQASCASCLNWLSAVCEAELAGCGSPQERGKRKEERGRRKEERGQREEGRGSERGRPQSQGLTTPSAHSIVRFSRKIQ